MGAGQAPDTTDAEGQEEKSEHSGLRSEWEVMRGERVRDLFQGVWSRREGLEKDSEGRDQNRFQMGKA